MAQDKRRVMRPGTKEVAARRYAELVDAELENLAGLFTERELLFLLDVMLPSILHWQVGMTLAGAVADTNGIETLDDGTPMAELVRKIAQLTPLQNLALVDVFESFYMACLGDPQSLYEFAAERGLVLA